MEEEIITIEDMIINVGSFLHNTSGSITDIDGQFLKDFRLLIDAELERREAQLH